jgi:anti-sigma B factor antagonist
MKFQTTQSGAVTVITLQGNLMGGPDASTLNGQLHSLLAEGKKHVVLDLAGVQFINSSGLGLLIGGVTTMRSAGGSLKIAGASEKILGLIRITKLESVFETYPSVDDAVASVKK